MNFSHPGQEDYDDHLAKLLTSSFNEDSCVFNDDLTLSSYLLPHNYGKYASLLPSDAIVENSILSLLKDSLYQYTNVNSKFEFAKMFSCRTIGDGDCLLHAVSLSVWGQDDKLRVIRQVLALTLISKLGEKFRTMWYEEERQNDSDMGLPRGVRSDQQLCSDFEKMISEAVEGGVALSGIHIACLAHIFKRPIIVLSTECVQPNAAQNPHLGGVYLPSLHPPNACSKRPIVLAFSLASGTCGHFTAVLIEEAEGGEDFRGCYLPLTSSHGRHFPLRFFYGKTGDAVGRHGDVAEEYHLLQEYLDMQHVPGLQTHVDYRLAKVLWTSDDADSAIPSDHRLEMGSQVRRSRYAFLGRAVTAMKEEQQQLEQQLQDLQVMSRYALFVLRVDCMTSVSCVLGTTSVRRRPHGSGAEHGETTEEVRAQYDPKYVFL